MILYGLKLCQFHLPKLKPKAQGPAFLCSGVGHSAPISALPRLQVLIWFRSLLCNQFATQTLHWFRQCLVEFSWDASTWWEHCLIIRRSQATTNVLDAGQKSNVIGPIWGPSMQDAHVPQQGGSSWYWKQPWASPLSRLFFDSSVPVTLRLAGNYAHGAIQSSQGLDAKVHWQKRWRHLVIARCHRHIAMQKLVFLDARKDEVATTAVAKEVCLAIFGKNVQKQWPQDRASSAQKMGGNFWDMENTSCWRSYSKAVAAWGPVARLLRPHDLCC